MVNSTTGGLFSVDPTTGTAELIDAPPVTAGDGLLLRGRTLYVVQNRLNQIAVVELDSGWESGQLVDVLTDADLDIPTTVARFGNALYAVNGRFTTPPTPSTPYQVVRVALALSRSDSTPHRRRPQSRGGDTRRHRNLSALSRRYRTGLAGVTDSNCRILVIAARTPAPSPVATWCRLRRGVGVGG